MNTVNKIKSIKLNKGMINTEVNSFTSEWLLLKDKIFLGVGYKHTWRCSCGRLFNRTWHDIRGGLRLHCMGSECYINILDQKGKDKKYIKLLKNMPKDDVNFVLNNQEILLDDTYIHSDYIHNWKCNKCGEEVKRSWNNLKKTEVNICRKCRYIKNSTLNSKLISESEDYLNSLKKSKIKGFEQYVVYEDGSIYSTITNKFLKGTVNCKNGYVYVVLRNKNGEVKNKAIHRIVAENLIYNPNPSVHNVINHKDYNRQNNTIDNLEWCTQLDNIRHCIDRGRVSRNTKTVIGLDSMNNVIIQCKGIRKLEREYGYNRGMIAKAIKNKTEYKGLYWMYKQHT